MGGVEIGPKGGGDTPVARVNPLKAICCLCGVCYRDGREPVTCLTCGSDALGLFCDVECSDAFWGAWDADRDLGGEG